MGGKVSAHLTRHFSGGEEPWHFREGSVGGGFHDIAPAEFYVMFIKNRGNQNG
jgi:hypothetical protein